MYVFKKHNMMRDIKFLVDKIITMISFLIITITNEKNILLNERIIYCVLHVDE